MRFHEKQLEVLRSVKYENPKILICSGAKRSGKTYVLTFVFMAHVAKYENKGLSFIIGGATQASIRRNILNDMENILNTQPGFIHADWCGNEECELKIKEIKGCKSRCILENESLIDGKCVCCGKDAKHHVVWGIQY